MECSEEATSVPKAGGVATENTAVTQAALADEAEAPALSLELRRTVEEQVDGLTEELERRCTRHVAEVKEGFLRDAVLFCDDLMKLRLQVAAWLEVVEKQGLELLARAGLTPIEVEGTEFDPSLQKVVSIKITPEDELDGTVADVLRAGYRRDDGRVFRPQEVVLYRKEASRDG
jgi:molecular chaperone GrpE (heat shock protein)